MTIKALKNSAPEADQIQSELNDVVQESTALPHLSKPCEKAGHKPLKPSQPMATTACGWVSLEMLTD